LCSHRFAIGKDNRLDLLWRLTGKPSKKRGKDGVQSGSTLHSGELVVKQKLDDLISFRPGRFPLSR
jgi:hypothetical protein